MPEFFPEHRDSGARKGDSADLRAFLRGYLACAEWLAGCDVNPDGELSDDRRDKARGWTRRAQREARQDCRAFLKAQRADLTAYCVASGRDMESAGHDFWLSRNGHGGGFFDRGNDPVFDRLQGAARVWRGVDCTLTRRGYFDFM